MTTSPVRAQLRARTVAIDTPTDLLAHLGPEGTAWLNGEHGFVTAGVAAVVDPRDATAFVRDLPHDRHANTPTTAGPRAVGALSFSGDGRMVVPATIVGHDPDGRAWCTIVDDAEPALPADATLPIPTSFTVVPCTSWDEWRDTVERALDLIKRDQLAKIVLARAVRVEADHPFATRPVLSHLRRMQPGCTVYADGGFVGASPELLVRKRGAHVLSRPLAGTGTDATQLLASAKDAHEHAIVVDAVRAALTASCDTVRIEGPAPLDLVDMTHLATTVTAHCADSRVSVIDLMQALHPTPAVAGTPRDLALATIAELEPIARDRYAGPCGWVDSRGDGAFVVALRGGLIDGRHALLHAGAGIVAGSDPAAEWAETQQKLEPMLRALIRP